MRRGERAVGIRGLNCGKGKFVGEKKGVPAAGGITL
jgi:hypothetical protein